MQAERTALNGRDGERHGSYRLRESCVSDQIKIVHDAGTGHHPRYRLVTTVDDAAGWDRFVAALEDGADEVAAVHAIDEEQR